MSLVSGRLFQLGTMIMFFVVVIFSLWRSRTKLPQVKTMPPLVAFKEAVGRSAELNRPVVFTPGWGGGNTQAIGADLLAGAVLLSDVAHQTATAGSKLIVMAGNPNTIPILEGAVREGYTLAGHLEEYSPDIVQFSTPELYSYSAWVAGAMRRHNAGANFMLGQHWMESLIFAEAGLEIGAFQVASSAMASQVPYFLATCDYVFIGPEIYAASAVVSQDRTQLGSLLGQDIITMAILALSIIGIMLITAKITWLTNIMRM